MSEKSELEHADDLLRKLQDILASQAALVEKLASAQMDALNAGFQSLMDSLDESFSNASKNRDRIKEIHQVLEMERNRLKGEAE